VPGIEPVYRSHREVKRGLLQKQVRRAGLTDQEYVAFFYDRVVVVAEDEPTSQGVGDGG
jgi:hypothetical protein